MAVEDAKASTLAGLEPTRNYSNRFLVGRLNHSATVSYNIQTPIYNHYQTYILEALDPRSNQRSYTDSIENMPLQTKYIYIYSHILNITSSLKYSHTTHNNFSTSAKYNHHCYWIKVLPITHIFLTQNND